MWPLFKHILAMELSFKSPQAFLLFKSELHRKCSGIWRLSITQSVDYDLSKTLFLAPPVMFCGVNMTPLNVLLALDLDLFCCSRPAKSTICKYAWAHVSRINMPKACRVLIFNPQVLLFFRIKKLWYGSPHYLYQHIWGESVHEKVCCVHRVIIIWTILYFAEI
jgi:hypothetical protein